jgi:cytidyltransferase-like protein
MKVHTNFENVDSIKNAVVTTGTFDGVHIGHKTILIRLKKLASESNGESVLITFQPHPAKILNPGTSEKNALITTKNEKIALLRETGIDHLFIMPVTPEFAKTIKKDRFSHQQNHTVFELIVEEKEKIIPPDGAYKSHLQEHHIEGALLVNKDTENTRLYFIPEDNSSLIQSGITYNYVFLRKLQHNNHIQKIQKCIFEHMYVMSNNLSYN